MADMLANPLDIGRLLGVPDIDIDRATILVEIATSLVQTAAGNQRILRVTNDVALVELDQYDVGLFLQLPQIPVLNVTSVLIGTNPVSDWTLQQAKGRLWRSTGWRGNYVNTNQPSTVTVTNTHGYLSGDWNVQPARTAVLGLIRTAYDVPGGQTSVKIDDYAATYDRLAARMEASPQMRDSLFNKYGIKWNTSSILTSRE